MRNNRPDWILSLITNDQSPFKYVNMHASFFQIYNLEKRLQTKYMK